MAAASQAASGEFDSRRLLQKKDTQKRVSFFLEIDLFVEMVRLSHAKLFFALGHARSYLSSLAYLAPKSVINAFLNG